MEAGRWKREEKDHQGQGEHLLSMKTIARQVLS
jgi:hypothetical protein